MICLYGKNILSAFSIRDNMVTVLLQNSLSNDIHTFFWLLSAKMHKAQRLLAQELCTVSLVQLTLWFRFLPTCQGS